jgi:hypothetical protein
VERATHFSLSQQSTKGGPSGHPDRLFRKEWIMSINFNFVSMVSQIALAAATGGASIAMQAAMKMIVQAVAQQVLQQLAQQLGLPPAVVNMAMQAFSAASGQPGGGQAMSLGQAVGGAAQLLNLSPAQEGQLSRDVNAGMQQILDNIRADRYGGTEGGRATTRGAAGKSWLLQIAELLGNKLNEAAEELKRKADATDWKDGKQMTEFNALNQQFNTLMSSINTAIKSLGEALSSMARKQ